MLLTCRLYPLSEVYRRGAGRSSTGGVTARHRSGYQLLGHYRSRFAAGLNRLIFLCLRSRRRGSLGWVLTDRGQLGVVSAVQDQPLLFETSLDPSLPRVGFTFPVGWIPVGSRITFFGFVARAAGTSCQVLRHRSGEVQLRLPSRRVGWFSSRLVATLGVNHNQEHKNRRLSSAGDSRWLGRRPAVRGVAMNPVDHPHGGGQGKTSGGGPARSPWGRLTKGAKH